MAKLAKVTLNDIPEFQRTNVHMKNPAEVERKINVILDGGFQQLQIVSDFDQTITKQRNENGKKPLTSFKLMHDCPSFPESRKIEAIALFEKYRPYEMDETLDRAEKSKIMLKWWMEEDNIMRGFKLPQSELMDTAKHSGATLRDGALDMIKYLYEVNVPVLVFSAGLGDSIMAVLKVNNVMFPNVKVFSNFLNYSDDEIVNGMIPPIIHILNKNEQTLNNTEYFDLIKDRGNVILMGDVVGDAGMADGVPHNTVLKIGFVYEKAEEVLPTYKEHFDIVLVDDQTMSIPFSILRLIGQPAQP